MDPREAARLEEHYRRWLRPDWRRWLRPDWERFVHPAHHAAMREDFAIRDRAFETPLARRLRKEKEAREQEALEAEQQHEIEREALKLKAELASLRFELAMDELRRKAGFNPISRGCRRVMGLKADDGQGADRLHASRSTASVP